MKKLLAALFLLLIFAAWAKDDGLVVWTEKNFPLAGRKVVLNSPVSDESGTGVPEQRLEEIRQTIEETLAARQLLARNSDNAPPSTLLTAHISVTSFKTGDAMGRWVGFGAGVAKCTLRAQLLDPESGVVAEIIDTRVVDTGGFYTIGADSKFHKELATELAGAMTRLLSGEGVKK
ncbi:MAG: DUF4410 domain-containing protein [Betaproteobacteria bacterium]|nr:DUF4410 domain-containing protein [Betaproteobacteria bacterium]